MSSMQKKAKAYDIDQYDVLPEQMNTWECIVADIRSSLHNTGYQKVINPLSEKYSTFTPEILDCLKVYDTDILFTVKKKYGETWVVSPPGPMSLFRTALENDFIQEGEPVKLYHYGVAMVDEDNDEQTEPHQFNVFKVECIGDKDAVRDAELLLTIYRMLNDLGLDNILVRINFLGTRKERQKYLEEIERRIGDVYPRIIEAYKHDPIQLYQALQRQMEEIQIPLPILLDYLKEKNSQHFASVLELLESLNIPYELDYTLAGSFGFNDSTYFEIISQDNPNIVLARGGRHDELLSEMTGKDHYGSVGGEIYIDTILQEVWQNTYKESKKENPQVFVASIGAEGQKKALQILTSMQDKGWGVLENLGLRTLRQQLQKAKKADVPITVIIGHKEALEGTVILRDKLGDNQEIVPLDHLFDIIEKKLIDYDDE